MKRPGLRARVTAILAGGALVLIATVATLSYEFIRSSLIDERERTATRTTYFDASAIQADLVTSEVDIPEVLGALDTGPIRRPIVVRDGTVYARNADLGPPVDIPEELRHLVESGQPAAQPVHTLTGAALIIGIPITPTTQFYEIHSLEELERTLSVIGLVLAAVAAGTTVAGAGLGWYTTRRVLRPLANVAAAAQGIAAGDLSARLDAATEPELERLTWSFNNMVDQLSRRIERDRRFAADVSHELRSPLQTLAAAASVIDNRRSMLDERGATAAQLVAAEIVRFQQLVTDLLEISRAEQPAELSTMDIVDGVRRLCRVKGLDPGIVTVQPGCARVWRVDRRRVERIVNNLLDNARQYGGGAVAVRIGQEGELGFIEVDDEGPGIVPEDRAGVFDAFVRGRNAAARGDGDGTGLGLAIVAQHAHAHQGRAFVLDRPGGGARFRVELVTRGSTS